MPKNDDDDDDDDDDHVLIVDVAGGRGTLSRDFQTQVS